MRVGNEPLCNTTYVLPQILTQVQGRRRVGGGAVVGEREEGRAGGQGRRVAVLEEVRDEQGEGVRGEEAAARVDLGR
jgi:hypothetical protein